MIFVGSVKSLWRRVIEVFEGARGAGGFSFGRERGVGVGVERSGGGIGRVSSTVRPVPKCR